ADAQRRFLRLDVIDLEATLGGVIAVLVAQLETTLGNQTDTAPLTVAHLEYVLDEPSRRRIAVEPHTASILGLDLRPAGFELRHRAQQAFEQVARLEAGDDNGHAIAAGDRLVLATAHHRTDVAWSEERLYAIARRLQDSGNHWWHEDV